MFKIIPINLEFKIIDNSNSQFYLVGGLGFHYGIFDNLNAIKSKEKFYLGNRIGILFRAAVNKNTSTKIQLFKFWSNNSYFARRNFPGGFSYEYSEVIIYN